MAELNPDRVVHDDEDEEQAISHEVALTVVAEQFVVFTHFATDLNRVCVDRLVADESSGEPDGHEAPEAHELDQKLHQVHIFDLGRVRHTLRFDNLDEVADDDKKRHQAHHGDHDLAKRQLLDTLDIHPGAVADVSSPDPVTGDASHQVHQDDQKRPVRDSVADWQFEGANVVFFECGEMESGHGHNEGGVRQEIVANLEGSQSCQRLESGRESIAAVVENQAQR
mmetsp:Transcript_45503/g.60365  ORF Transcript_45503/g.60365 Transcript_45503/m.60365 type:complete len:225 (+) Transcript_45503:216-890(+)|eukprot:CAMPEP_0185571758 /NCGR_PEP_ID=MMETSP0434-20130131/3767_1 /TAXON_ID=626734 ORGANISM="Favella taraikaensis, Strain Fe Narragansett Bay" /NCGR_SAMPLE_ID=MMETSP0434 /ASSEMBLY_ACC=CAM_ASM_000379 /LENGTH=224 /DNA_ID=CAMNT_0028187341 /DNA_START=461 /DNA_END=1135 /DNA_ORIENTATION=+